MPTILRRALLALASLLAAGTPALATQSDNHVLRAVPAPAAVTLDGALDDWDLSGRITVCSDLEHLLGRSSAEVAMMYDDQALYVAADWYDPTPMTNNYDGRLDVDRRFAFHSDSLQLHFKTDRLRNVFLWWYAKGGVPGCYAMDGLNGFAAKDIAYLDGEALGIRQAYRLHADGRGYTQEARIPWAALSTSGHAYRAGERFGCMLDLVWGPDSGKGWPVDHCMDLVQPGANHGGWFWEVGEIHGAVELAASGHLEPVPVPAPRAAVDKPAGAIAVRAAIPADATRLTLVIDDAGGRRVRNLAGDLDPAACTVAVHGGVRTVEVGWDGRDDHGVEVAPGTYAVRGLTQRGLDAFYEQCFYNPGTPPWETADGRGGWGADHAGPSAVCAAGDGVVIGCAGAEGGSGIFGVGPDGLKRWGEKQGARRLAGDGEHVYFLLDNVWAQRKGLARMDARDGGYRPWRIDGRDEFPVALERILGDGKPRQALGLAAHGGVLALALEGGTLALIDAATATLRRRFEVPGLGAVAFGDHGALYALVGGGVARLDPATGAATPVATPGLGHAAALACDHDGDLVVADTGPDCQVKAFTPAGAVAYTCGAKGGRPASGVFDPQAMMRMSAVAVDRDGRIWVTEDWNFPRRVSVWGRDGRLVRDYIGNTGYAGVGAFLHDQDPTLAYVGAVELKLDRPARGWSVSQVLWVPDPAAGEGFPIDAQDNHQPQRLTSSASGQPREYLYNHQGAQVVYMPRHHRWQPVAALCNVEQVRACGGFDGLRGDQGVYWSDRDGDGKVSRGECVIDDRPIPMQRAMTDWGRRIGDDLSIWTLGITRFEPLRFTPEGAPVYGPEGRRELACREPGDYVPVPGEDLLLCLGFRDYPHETPGFLGVSTRDGTVRWSYPDRWPSVHGSHGAPPAAPGRLIGPLRIVGTARIDERVGTVCMLRGNLGEDFLFTTDGLYVGALFADGRLPGPPLPPRETELVGRSMAAFTHGSEPFNGWFGKQADGVVRTVTGFSREAAMILRITGLDGIRRFDAPALQVDAAALRRAADELAARSAAATDARAYRIARFATAPTIDGALDEWATVPAMDIPLPGGAVARARLASDGRWLFAAFEVPDPSPWRNQGHDRTRLFKTGDACDLQLSSDPAPHREPQAGDQRVCFAALEGRPVAVLMRPRDAAAPPELRVDYHSPVGERHFDRVEVLAEARVAVASGPGWYRLEAALPLAALGIAPGRPLRGDAGVIQSDAEGMIDVARSYWSNRATVLVSDLPEESWLHPDAWGGWSWSP